MARLTAQQELFVDEYIRLRCKNAKQAAINAGYSRKTAYSQGSRLLKNVELLKLVERRKSELLRGLQEEFIFDALTARNVMYKILSDEGAQDKDRITAAKDFLDRAGLKATEKVVAKVDHGSDPYDELTVEELRKLLAYAETED